MGGAKNKQMDDQGSSAARWKHVAVAEGYACIRCGNLPEFEDREEYFESKLCGWCLHQTQKGND